MSLDYLERSEFGGAPISLLKFESGAMSTPILWTDVAFPVAHDGLTYMPTPLKVGGVSQSDTLDKATVQIECPTDAAVPMLFRYYPLGGVVNLTVLYGHDGDPAGEFVPIWSGRVVGVTHADDQGTATLECEPISTSLMRTGLRRNYQRMCPHALYGDKCRVNKAAHTIAVTVADVQGSVVRVTPEIPSAGQFAGGIASWTRQVSGQIPLRDERMITEAIPTGPGESAFKIMGAIIGLQTGAQLAVTRGCDHGLDTCTNIFDNAPNYGGMPWIPTDNPTSGGSIY